MSRQILSLSLTLIFAWAGIAAAQTYATPGVVTGDYGYVNPGLGFGNFSSTYEEGVLRGMGAYAQSVGQANYLNSLASINQQEAFSRALANQEKKTETYFRLKQINHAARNAQQPSRLTTEQYTALAKRQAPDRLSASDYDRALGLLNWPGVLQGDEFAAQRELLDRLFATRSPNDTGLGSRFHGQVKQLTTTMQEQLQSEISTMGSLEFIAAKKFLTGLAYEAQQPLADGAVAVIR